ncbi:MAG: acetyl-CoA C-acyltransferase, partial [Thermomicrobiales bacterium]
MTSVNESVILGGARTPFGKLNGGLSSLSAVELGSHALRASISRVGIDPAVIGHVVMGQAIQAGAGQNPARQVSAGSGLDRTATSETINHVCGSGIRAVALADMAIRLGDHQVVAAGGMESMSRAPYLLRDARGGYRMGDGALVDSMMADGLWCALDSCAMGLHGDHVAAEERVSREEQDAWALRSHTLALGAIDSGWMARQIAPIEIVGRKSSVTVTEDEAPRRDTSAEALARLKPAFSPDGSVTAGNAPGVNDGAATLIVSGAAWAQDHGVAPRARILGHAQAAWDAPYLAYTPAMATEKALKKAGLAIADVDLFEINEAFASVTLISARRLGIDLDRVNVHGGAIALGHPLAASGGRILLTLIQALEDRGGGIGVAAICTGGGQGDAMVIEVG